MLVEMLANSRPILEEALVNAHGLKIRQEWRKDACFEHLCNFGWCMALASCESGFQGVRVPRFLRGRAGVSARHDPIWGRAPRRIEEKLASKQQVKLLYEGLVALLL